MSSTPTPSISTPRERPLIGAWVDGYDIPVINERAARAAAGLLFLFGAIAWGLALHTGSTQPLRPFGMFFMLDMALRVGLSDRWSPTLALVRLIVSRQVPEWVGAPQKAFAWWLGFGLVVVACASMGLLQAPAWVTLAICAGCLIMLFLETAFGICVGCSLQRLFTKQSPQYCPGGSCEMD